MGFSRQEYWAGCPFLFQGIFLTQGSNPPSCIGRQAVHHCATREAQSYECCTRMMCAEQLTVFGLSGHALWWQWPHFQKPVIFCLLATCRGTTSQACHHTLLLLASLYKYLFWYKNAHISLGVKENVCHTEHLESMWWGECILGTLVSFLFQELNRLRKAALAFGFLDLLKGVADMLERECTLLPDTAHPDAAFQLTHAAQQLKLASTGTSEYAGYDHNITPLQTDFSGSSAERIWCWLWKPSFFQVRMISGENFFSLFTSATATQRPSQDCLRSTPHRFDSATLRRFCRVGSCFLELRVFKSQRQLLLPQWEHLLKRLKDWRAWSPLHHPQETQQPGFCSWKTSLHSSPLPTIGTFSSICGWERRLAKHKPNITKLQNFLKTWAKSQWQPLGCFWYILRYKLKQQP